MIEQSSNWVLAPVLESNGLATASQLKAERAFRGGEYGKAARFAGLATSLDESNGMILLFKLQAHFANGEFQEAYEALAKAGSLLPADQLGWVVQNFKLFYGKNDFVSQMKSLSGHLKSDPNGRRCVAASRFPVRSSGVWRCSEKGLDSCEGARRGPGIGGENAVSLCPGRHRQITALSRFSLSRYSRHETGGHGQCQTTRRLFVAEVGFELFDFVHTALMPSTFEVLTEPCRDHLSDGRFLERVARYAKDIRIIVLSA